jgi:hypothetical protein
MKTSFSTLIAALLMLVACSKKEKDTTITGQVRTFGTEEAIKHPPVEVVIYERQVSGTFMGGPSYKVVASTTTDQNANYSLTAKLHTDKEYYLGVEANTVNESYHYYQPIFSSKDLPERKINTIGGNYTKNYYLTARGWVRFHLVSENPQPGDVFSYNFGSGSYELFYGNVDAIRIWDFSGNREHRLSFELRRNDIWSNWQENLFVPAFDTIDYQVKFN